MSHRLVFEFARRFFREQAKFLRAPWQMATSRDLAQARTEDDAEGERFMKHVQAVDAEKLRAIARKYLNDPVTVIISQSADELAE